MDFPDLLQSHEVVLVDGAMGTELGKRGLEPGGQSSLTNPEAVLEVHAEYARCGCHALTTNTLTMNGIYIETHGLGVTVRDVNLASAELAREAAGNRLCVLGNLSSTAQMLEPYGTYKESQFHDTFREQAEALAEGGVDGFIIETMFDLREALCALRACKDAALLPVIASVAYATADKGGRTIMGNCAADCARELTENGADVVGVNCGDLDPSQMALVVSLLRSATCVPIMAEPNAGKPKLVDGRTVFDMAPEPFAAGIAECLRAGARVVGGCCGTGPEHIRAAAAVLGAVTG